MSDLHSEASTSPAVVAFGGGHGLAASLAALRRVTPNITAVVTVADDGGSSGRLRRDLGVLPPGDLRMALAALCEDDEWGHTWSQVVQHRFGGPGDLAGHSVGNLLIVALWELAADDPVQGLDWMGRLLKSTGRVLPMATVPLEIEASVEQPDGCLAQVRGQEAVATATGRIVDVSLWPSRPPACAEAVVAIYQADWVVLGPGSWFTSVIPHLLVPELATAIGRTNARRMVVLNLEPQQGETTGFTPASYLEVLEQHAPGLRIDVVLADPAAVADLDALEKAAANLGAEVRLAAVRDQSGLPMHDPDALAAALRPVLTAPQPPQTGPE
ncbi:MAG: uridine diphosphate-N-acetylglucosamine-binding protein YvcK [Actinomycetia bacterium]|nr:uridine diphosphate-N-acetylglucosamine-binding protein YvcK [Actinomycetes bacterium]